MFCSKMDQKTYFQQTVIFTLVFICFLLDKYSNG